MGNTANLALPYPENTDPLANMAAAIQALAQAVDSGGVGGAWVPWVPVPFNFPATVSYARQRTTGKTVRAEAKFVLTGAATGILQVSIPATARAGRPFSIGSPPVGLAHAHLPGNTTVPGVVMIANSNLNSVGFWSTSAQNVGWAQTAPFTWASGAELGFSIEYEKA